MAKRNKARREVVYFIRWRVRARLGIFSCRNRGRDERGADLREKIYESFTSSVYNITTKFALILTLYISEPPPHRVISKLDFFDGEERETSSWRIHRHHHRLHSR